MKHPEIDILRVTDAEYIKDYTIRLTFSDGKEKFVDFLPLLTGKWLEPLKEIRNFVQYGLTSYTLEWYNGADFAPEFLYEHGVDVKQAV